MTHIGTVLLAGPALALGLAISAAPAATTYVDVDFNSVTIPTPPGYVNAPTSAAVAGVTSTRPTAVRNTATIATRVYGQFTDSVTGNTLGGAGNQVLIISDQGTGASDYSSTTFGLNAADMTATGVVEITFKLIADSADGSAAAPDNNEISITALNQAGKNITNYKFRPKDTAIYGVETDINGTATGSPSTRLIGAAGSFVAGQVYGVRIRLDLDSNKASLFLDNSLIAANLLTDGTYTSDIADGATFGGLFINTPGASTFTLGIDDVKIALIPEPAAWSLMTLGAACIGLRRRG